MKFENVALQGFSLTVSEKTIWTMIELRLDGAIGYGDATVFGSEMELSGLIESLRRWIDEQPGVSLADVTTRILQTDPSLARRSLASALEQAWLSALAMRADLPMHAMLGGAVREVVPFYANVNRGILDRSPDGFAAQAKRVLQGSSAAGVKIAPFDGLRFGSNTTQDSARLFALGVDRIAAVRSAIGPDALLLVDCHARLSELQVMSLIKEAETNAVYWLEDLCEPAYLSRPQAQSIRHRANDKGIRIAGGESLKSLSEAAQFFENRSHDVVLPDIRFAGVMQGLSILRLAESHGVELSLHNPVGPVLNAVATHVAASLPSFSLLERQLGETALYDQIADRPLACKDGGLTVPKKPGLGIGLNTELLTQVSSLGSGFEGAVSFRGMKGAGPDA